MLRLWCDDLRVSFLVSSYESCLHDCLCLSPFVFVWIGKINPKSEDEWVDRRLKIEDRSIEYVQKRRKNSIYLCKSIPIQSHPTHEWKAAISQVERIFTQNSKSECAYLCMFIVQHLLPLFMGHGKQNRNVTESVSISQTEIFIKERESDVSLSDRERAKNKTVLK